MVKVLDNCIISSQIRRRNLRNQKKKKKFNRRTRLKRMRPTLVPVICIFLLIRKISRYGEVVWLKVFDFPYWPAVILHPAWISPLLAGKLKLSKKKIQNRLIVQFFDEVNSSQVVGIKNISYPFEAYYAEYTKNNSIDPSFIERAKEV
ncbi:hypothetical protein JH06_1988 [Blastocystis sp. subtype 4]|uniref:hypothetical protein n=1 Tax=Blastocystis sp. subtype 4 TaxID=944170 RepID=UPI000711707F|nr:hypothetical protein JH06_1988 [Blastocystis sp. subtype 4]KNB44124.1 hypothetical protein JH06_1988 [Blastocystis sp. subtype 4]|eukprot:XP_014527567.1 hypothetical protein JH06_1988 [Blastocystis sp. subtype 4]